MTFRKYFWIWDIPQGLGDLQHLALQVSYTWADLHAMELCSKTWLYQASAGTY